MSATRPSPPAERAAAASCVACLKVVPRLCRHLWPVPGGLGQRAPRLKRHLLGPLCAGMGEMRAWQRSRGLPGGGPPPPPPPLHACQHLGLCVRAGALLSAPDDPWPVNPASPDVERFNAYLWAQGVNLVIT